MLENNNVLSIITNELSRIFFCDDLYRNGYGSVALAIQATPYLAPPTSSIKDSLVNQLTTKKGFLVFSSQNRYVPN